MRLLLLLCSLCMDLAQAAEFSARVDRPALPADEFVTLTLSLTNSDTRLRAEGVSPNVDLSVLTRDFKLGTPRADNRFNISREGGRSTSSISVELFPKHAGQLTIPSFALDGARTRAITLSVMAAQTAAPEVFVRRVLSKPQVWDREQVVAALDLYHRVPLSNASLGDELATEPVRLELMDYRKLPQGEREEHYAGYRYHVQRIAWAVFPRAAQTTTLRVVFPDVWAVTAAGKKLRLSTEAATLTVKPLPAGVTEDTLIGTPQIEQTTPAELPDLNSVTTWSVTLKAPVSINRLPATLPLAITPPQLKLYRDMARRDIEEDSDGLRGVAHYTLSVTPLAAGRYVLPAIQIPYFDTTRGTLEKLIVPGSTLKVRDLPQAAPSKATTALPTPPSPPATFPALILNGWQIATALLSLFWLGTLWLWYRERTRHLPRTAIATPPATRSIPTRHPLQIRLLDAFQARTLEQGLRAWEHRTGQHDTTLRATIRQVQALCYGPALPIPADLEHAVTAALIKIRATPLRQDAVCVWPKLIFQRGLST